MGKFLQIGTWKEIIDLCALDEHLIPTFDFGHINSLTQGGLKTKEQYKEIFEYCFAFGSVSMNDFILSENIFSALSLLP